MSSEQPPEQGQPQKRETVFNDDQNLDALPSSAPHEQSTPTPKRENIFEPPATQSSQIETLKDGNEGDSLKTVQRENIFVMPSTLPPCPQCGKPIQPGQKNCPNCQSKKSDIFSDNCEACGKPILVGLHYCPNCKPATPPPTPPPPSRCPKCGDALQSGQPCQKCIKPIKSRKAILISAALMIAGVIIFPSFCKLLFMERLRASLGSTEAMNQIAWRYREGHGVPLNFSQAADWFTKAANLGSVKGQYDLGIMYYYGFGLTQNLNTACDWFQKSANNNYPPAFSMLGLIAVNEDQDDNKAMEELTKAVALGDPMGEYLMGLEYLKHVSNSDNETQREQNLTQALYWLEKSRKNGMQPVAGLIEQVWHSVPNESVNQVKDAVLQALQKGVAP